MRNRLDRGIKVYLASPYTIGDVAVNVKAQIDMADTLMNMGYTPFLPLLYHFQHMIHPRKYEDWLEIDLKWLEACNYVIRFGGESKGADQEVKKAKTLGLPVFYSIADMDIHYFNTH